MSKVDEWMGFAASYEGKLMEPRGDNRSKYIDELIKRAGAGRPGDPYCAIGVNAALESAGITGTRSAGARSFEWDGGKNFRRLPGPAYGAIVVFWRKSPRSGFGHVGFYVGETRDHVYVLGFNQDDGVNESPFPKKGRSFGLVGYYWPVSVPAPEIEAIDYQSAGGVREVSAT